MLKAQKALTEVTKNRVSFPFYYWTLWLLARVYFTAWADANSPGDRFAAKGGARSVQRALAFQARAQIIARPAFQVVNGIVLALGGKQAAAHRALRLAIRVGAELSMPYEVHQARTLLGMERAKSLAQPTPGLNLLPEGAAESVLSSRQ